MEERCDTSLTLGLGRPSKPRRQKTSPPLEPSLSLSSSAAPQKEPRTSPPLSSVSSYSTTNVKRERLEEEAEVARGSSSRASEEEDEVSVRKKLRLTKDQSALLEDRFKEHTTLNPKQKQGLAKQLNLRPRQIEVWFQNRRARTKLKQTEVDCEFLRRCCDSLTEENTRLKKEVHELKALKYGVSTASPMFVHLPAATLTVCPSCDSIAPPKPPHHFFNPFAHSATC